MKNNLIKEIVASFILVVLLLLFLNPFGFWMPNTLLMMMMLGFIVVFVVFASFVWKENSRDEREGLHRMAAGRIAFLFGTSILVIGIIVQRLKHELDFWLVVTLGVMILAKIVGHI